MAFFDWVKFLRANAKPRAKGSPKKNPGRSRPTLEALEGRILFAVLPVSLVNNATTVAAGFSPSLVQDPSNPQNLVEFHSNGSVLVGNYSTDGGGRGRRRSTTPPSPPSPSRTSPTPTWPRPATSGTPRSSRWSPT